MIQGFERLAVPLQSSDGSAVGWWIIEASSRQVSLDLSECVDVSNTLPQGWKAKPCPSESESLIRVIQRADQVCIQLKETVGYEWGIECKDQLDDLEIASSLDSQNWKTRKKQGGEFKVINHLGIADFSLNSESLRPIELCIEVVSRKFDFETEYRRMTEDIAGFCQQLLLNWEAPTSLSFNADPAEKSRLLLEQFLFLRHFMNEDRLSRLLEAIDRNPHSTLIKEENWVPPGAARSSDYLSNPIRMLRGWRGEQNNRRPSEVMETRKKDSHDTAPNRFIKYALSSFRQLCDEVCTAKWQESGKVSSIGLEALELIEALDALLARRFFNEVGRMQRLPLDNQTLQKREGYREVLQAWLLTQAASSLNWEGEQESYSGSTRDVATLYEYWIFIQLHELLNTLPGIQILDKNPCESLQDFISENRGQLTINLKRGKQSCSSYLWKGQQLPLRIDLHYERSFNYNQEATLSGSYSRRFRPDYTLSIFPANYVSEGKAEKAGKVAHLHFDAKYRAEDVANVFGNRKLSDEEIAEEKAAGKSEQTYKRGDLLKMHTYNDALRHTIGSYVLYPGTNTDTAEKLAKFHEIAPGVGAMVMKPGNENCLNTIKGFLLDVLAHQSDSFSQYRYVSDTSHQTHGEAPQQVEEGPSKYGYSIARKQAPCVLLYAFKDQAKIFREFGFAYCRVDSNDKERPLNLDLSIEIGSEFIPYGGRRGEAKTTLGWRGKVRSARFIQIEELKAYIAKTYPKAEVSPTRANHYLLFEFSDAADFKKLKVDALHRSRSARSPYMAISCTWQEILDQADA